MADFTEPCVLICEGPGDAAFLNRLLAVNSIAGFQIFHTGKHDFDHGGNSKFGQKLRSLEFRNYGKITHIVLVSDKDDDANGRFESICEQIEQVGFGPRPTESLVASSGKPPITIIMLPTDAPEGNLECTLLETARAAHPPTTEAVNCFEGLMHADKWPFPRRGKMWLRVYLAARAANPFIPLSKVFIEKHDDLLSLTHVSLEPLIELLRTISSLPPRRRRASKDDSSSPARKSARRPRGPQMRPKRGRNQ